MSGFVLGSVLAQFLGAWAFLTAKRRFGFREVPAAIISGLATTVVASVAYTIMRVHEWLAGPGANWGVSVFLAACVGLTQGFLFRSRPLAPHA